MRTFAEKQNRPQPDSSSFARSITTAAVLPYRSDLGFRLQRTIGNQAAPPLLPHVNPDNFAAGLITRDVTRLAWAFSEIPVFPKSSARAQTKLTVSPAGDMYDQEADRVSEQLLRMPEPQLQRRLPRCGEERQGLKTEQAEREPERVRTKHVGAGGLGQFVAPPIVNEVVSSPGQPLDPIARGFMEPRLGHDFSRVRIHTDAKAAESAQAIGAVAYTVGQNVVFGAGQYAPGAAQGHRLLAHELTHVVQQTSQEGGPGTVVMRTIGHIFGHIIYDLLLHWLLHGEDEETAHDPRGEWLLQFNDTLRGGILLEFVVGHIEDLAKTFDGDSILYTAEDVSRIKRYVWEIFEIAHTLDVGIGRSDYEVMLEGKSFVKVSSSLWSWREKVTQLLDLMDELQIEIERGEVLKAHGPHLTSVPDTPPAVDPYEVVNAFFDPVSTGESVELNVRPPHR